MIQDFVHFHKSSIGLSFDDQNRQENVIEMRNI